MESIEDSRSVLKQGEQTQKSCEQRTRRTRISQQEHLHRAARQNAQSSRTDEVVQESQDGFCSLVGVQILTITRVLQITRCLWESSDSNIVLDSINKLSMLIQCSLQWIAFLTEPLLRTHETRMNKAHGSSCTLVAKGIKHATGLGRRTEPTETFTKAFQW